MLIALLLIVAGSEALSERADPCRGDRNRYCANVEKGKGRHRKCLVEHKAELSEACREHIAAVEARPDKRAPKGRRGDGLRKACSADLAERCPTAIGKRGKVMQCLRRNESDLSQPCQAKLRDLKGVPRVDRAAPKDSVDPK